MKRIFTLQFLLLCFTIHLFAQKDIPVFAQHGECHLNVGYVSDVIIKGDIAYCGTDAGLLLLDISNPQEPEFLSCYYTEKTVYKVFITDTVAVFTEEGIGYNGVSFINIKNPLTPEIIYAFEFVQFGVESIFLDNNVLFLGNSYYGLHIYDISDLLNPLLITTLPDINAVEMIVKDQLLYLIANYGYHFGILDISQLEDPDTLCWLGGYDTSRDAFFLKDNLIYIAGKTLEVFDISNPANPELKYEEELTTGWLEDISIHGNACVTRSEDSLYVLNIEEPESPVLMDECDYRGHKLDVSGNLIITVKDYEYDVPHRAISLFEIDANQQLDLTSEYFTDFAKDVYIHGNYAYVANGFNGMRIIDITNPANPYIVSDCLEGNCVIELLVENEFAYVRTIDGFMIVDISEPEFPEEVGGYSYPYFWSVDGMCAIEKYGNYLYIGGDGFGEINVFDVSYPANPFYLDQFPVNDWSPDLTIHDGHLYASGYWGGLMIFDLSNPVYPPVVGTHPMPFSIHIAANDDAAFVGGVVEINGPGGVQIFDLNNMNNPEHIGTYETGYTDLQCMDQYLFVARRDYLDQSSSIRIVDMSDIENPVLVQEIFNVNPNGLYSKGEELVAVEDFKFKIFGDSLTVSNQEYQIEDNDIELSCYPNPASSHMKLNFSFDHGSTVELAVYDIRGKLVKVIVSKKLDAGNQSINWNLENGTEQKLPNGIYFISLLVDDKRVTRKVIISNNQ